MTVPEVNLMIAYWNRRGAPSSESEALADEAFPAASAEVEERIRGEMAALGIRHG